MEDKLDLIDTFIEEAREHLPIIEQHTLALENNPNDENLLNILFRSVHTIKGGAGFLGFHAISELTHSMESLLTKARHKKLNLTDQHIDLLLNCNDSLATMLNDVEHSNQIPIKQLCQLLDQATLHNDDIIQQTAKKITPPIITPIEQTDQVNNEELVSSFIDETSELIPKIEYCLLSLEQHPNELALLNELFRHIHTIKGGANFLHLTKIANLTHIMEDVLSVAKSAKLLLDENSLEVLLDAHDLLAKLMVNYYHDSPIEIEQVCANLNALLNDEKPDKIIPAIQEKPKNITANPIKESEKPNLTEIETYTPNIETEESIRVHVKRLNKLIDLVGELVLVRNQLFRLTENFIPQVSGLKNTLHNFNRITTEIQEEMMSTRMQPIGIIFNKFPRLIRQLEKDLGKNINLITEGADVELDKTIIESLTDPVTHIIRNMADHGIEHPEERIKKGKPASGTLLQKAFHEGGQVVIQFSDDGKGIDPDFIATKAIQKNIITADMADKMTAKEKIALVFTAGFSTAETLSAVSGRGVGMDVVKTNIEACGGNIDINSELGKWTSITMTLPLTMAIISSLIVRVHKHRFAFPQNNLEEEVLLDTEDYAKRVSEVYEQRMLNLRGTHLPLISLAESLQLQTKEQTQQDFQSNKTLYILIIKSDNNRVAVIVDAIIGNEEIVVKPIPEYFKDIKKFSGLSILGDGNIAMIIDVQCFILANQLAYNQKNHIPSIIQRKIAQETQSLLIFDNNTEERFALALSLIKRIDRLSVKDIQWIAGHEYIKYLGEQVRLLRLENCLTVQKPKGYQENVCIIFPKNTQIPIALLINKVIDTKDTLIKLENAAIKTEGVLGSMLLDGKITLILDLYTILQKGSPDSVAQITVNVEKARNKHILLVEDTPFFMRVIKECLVSAGYQVSTATNGSEGLELLTNQEFDLVLSDIEMPVMDGREMLKNIRANSHWQSLPVIALTTLNDSQVVAEGKKAGFNDWLVKLDKELVLKTLANYL